MNYLGIAYSFGEVGLGYGYNSMMFGVIQFCSMFFTSTFFYFIKRLYCDKCAQKKRDFRILFTYNDGRIDVFYYIRSVK